MLDFDRSTRLAVLTSVDTRHRYVANQLRAAFNVVAIGYEQTGYAPAEVKQTDLTEDEARIVDYHFIERTNQEEKFFGHDAAMPEATSDCSVLQITPGQLNSHATQQFLQAARADVVVVYGTNLIKGPLLEQWSGRMINLHLGLSPYYRGTATNFYPLVNEEPQFVGATVHLLDAGIDSGPILRHARPEIVAEDLPHTIGCKAIQAGIGALCRVVQDMESGGLHPVPQWTVENPRLYLRKDYSPRHVVQLYRKIEEGMIARYVERAESLASEIRLVEDVCA